VEIAIKVVPASRTGDDRAEAFPRPDGHLLVLADGAGGTSGGSLAADVVLDSSRSFSPSSAADCTALLEDLDRRLTSVGQTTAVVVVVSEGQIFGASVGDSGAWLVAGTRVTDLTEHQKRKPLLGSGDAVPVGFGPLACVGRVLIGSDGLFKYVPYDRIRELVSSLPVVEAPAALVDAARLRSGALQDDIAVLVATTKE
jgi:serine/threonine protein phosphatase PrpC